VNIYQKSQKSKSFFRPHVAQTQNTQQIINKKLHRWLDDDEYRAGHRRRRRHRMWRTYHDM